MILNGVRCRVPQDLPASWFFIFCKIIGDTHTNKKCYVKFIYMLGEPTAAQWMVVLLSHHQRRHAHFHQRSHYTSTRTPHTHGR